MKIRGGIQSIPRFHPGYGFLPSLIDALTGVPVRPFPTGSSEVVSPRAVLRMPCTKWHPLWESCCQRMSSSLLLPRKKYHRFFRKSMGLGEDPCCQIGKSSAEKKLPVVHNAKATRKKRKMHNTTTYVNGCNFSTPDIVPACQNTIYI